MSYELKNRPPVKTILHQNQCVINRNGVQKSSKAAVDWNSASNEPVN